MSVSEKKALTDKIELLEDKLEKALAENECLRKELEEALRSLKRQAAPFSKNQPKADPKPPGRKPGHQYARSALLQDERVFFRAHRGEIRDSLDAPEVLCTAQPFVDPLNSFGRAEKFPVVPLMFLRVCGRYAGHEIPKQMKPAVSFIHRYCMIHNCGRLGHRFSCVCVAKVEIFTSCANAGLSNRQAPHQRLKESTG